MPTIYWCPHQVLKATGAPGVKSLRFWLTSNVEFLSVAINHRKFLHSTHSKKNSLRGIKFHRQISSPIFESLQIYSMIYDGFRSAQWIFSYFEFVILEIRIQKWSVLNKELCRWFILQKIINNTEIRKKQYVQAIGLLFDPVCTYFWSWCMTSIILSLIHIWRCRRYSLCRSRWSPYH